MSDHIALLDASALVAVLLQEPGHEAVEAVLATGRAATTSLGLAETLHVCRRREHELDSRALRTVLESMALHVESVIDADADAIVAVLATADASRAAAGGARVPTLSIADATCIAVARRLDLPVVTADRFWSELDLDVVVRQFR